jgi:superfamily II DNA helicase RecQ
MKRIQSRNGMVICYIFLVIYHTYFRGGSFRSVLLRIGEIRSLIPDNVNVMALIATVTKSSCTYICQILGMSKPVVVTLSPDKPNIKYTVKMSDDVSATFKPIIQELRYQCGQFPRTIIYCRRFSDCGDL